MIINEKENSNVKNDVETFAIQYPDIKTFIKISANSKIDTKSFENIQNILNNLYSNLWKNKQNNESEQNSEVILLLDLKCLNSINITELLIEVEKSSSLIEKGKEPIMKSFVIFISLKYIFQLSQINSLTNAPRANNDQKLLSIINNEFQIQSFKDIIFESYKRKLFELNINPIYEFISKEKEIFNKSLITNDISDNILSKLKFIYQEAYSSKNYNNICSLFINQISFIHLNEYLVCITKSCNDDKKFLVANLQMNLLMNYFAWRKIIEVGICIN